MIDTNAIAARGTAMLAFSQGLYFFVGYLAVVLMARELGPAAYGAYGVIMSVLVWLEESGRHAIPSATTKLVAETGTGSTELENCVVFLNLGLHVVLFLLLYGTAPWLSSWFGLADGTLLFRIAAIDLPFFGVYTACRAIHQGHRRFVKLGLSQVVYALAKLTGVLLFIQLGLSVKNALLVNVAATIIGLMFLLPGAVPQWQSRWREQIAPLVFTAVPMGLYYFVLLLRGWLTLWALQIMSPPSAGHLIGVFVAAYNIARVPSMVLMTVTTVILPSISKAVAANDEPLAMRYLHQALRFGLILYVPVCLVFMAQPEELLQWIYSKDFSGGGVIFGLLVVGEGLQMVHAIFGTALTAAGEARKAALVTGASLIPALVMLVLLIQGWGATGAALSNALTILLSSVVLGILAWKRFGALMNKRSVRNIGFAACVMFLTFALLANYDSFLLPCTGGLAAYFVALIAVREITRQDFALIPWIKYSASPGTQPLTK